LLENIVYNWNTIGDTSDRNSDYPIGISLIGLQVVCNLIRWASHDWEGPPITFRIRGGKLDRPIEISLIGLQGVCNLICWASHNWDIRRFELQLQGPPITFRIVGELIATVGLFKRLLLLIEIYLYLAH
jgi:hypothetical protein